MWRTLVCRSYCNYSIDKILLTPADTPLPKESRALLKWKVCSLTPNIVKKCISRVGFTKITSEYRSTHLLLN